MARPRMATTAEPTSDRKNSIPDRVPLTRLVVCALALGHQKRSLP